jgi:hypothetical protein
MHGGPPPSTAQPPRPIRCLPSGVRLQQGSDQSLQPPGAGVHEAVFPALQRSALTPMRDVSSRCVSRVRARCRKSKLLNRSLSGLASFANTGVPYFWSGVYPTVSKGSISRAARASTQDLAFRLPSARCVAVAADRVGLARALLGKVIAGEANGSRTHVPAQLRLLANGVDVGLQEITAPRPARPPLRTRARGSPLSRRSASR